MNLGKRDRLVTLLRPETGAQNDFGETAPLSFANAGEEWAEIKYPTGREATEAAQQTAVQPVTFTIRYRADVRATWQVQHEGQTYQLTAVAEVGRRVGLILTAYSRDNGQ